MADTIEQNKVVSLFQFISELNKLKQKAILNYKDYPYFWEISKIPNDPDNIKIYYRDRVDEEIFDAATDSGDVLLSVHKPEFQKCPEPDLIFKDWLNFGWDNFHNAASVKDSVQFDKALISYLENFTDSKERTAKYEIWLKRREIWAERQKIIEATRKLFDKMYSVYFELQRESETEEIIVTNGILCDRDNPEIYHPVLTHRVKIDYDADKNTIFILDTAVPSEFYSTALNTLANVNSINDLFEELQENDYHPLDRNATPIFLKKLVHQLTSESIFSESGVPTNWKNDNRLLLYIEPVYIVRKRPDGTLKAIEQIIKNVQDTGEIPAPISDLVSGGKIEISEDVDEESIEEQLAAIGGESVDILLSKEANREQLEIARRIENYNAVLVQGPPGTGKTHTIANLMGHFLAQGKSVLVTSHTTKALSVLKEKVATNLQSLCVSMLDDSNFDMERSIDGITEYMSNNTAPALQNEMAKIAEERKYIIQKLADVRRKIFQIIHQECNCIVYNGKDILPSQAAKFVADNAENLSYIPGKVRLRTPLPLTFAQLTDLYRSNESLSAEDEMELANNLPSPEQILRPDEFSLTWKNFLNAQNKIKTITTQNNWEIDTGKNFVRIEGKFSKFSAELPNSENVQDLMNYVQTFEKIEQWMKVAAVAGKKGGKSRELWEILINQIQKANDYAEKIMAEQFGVEIQFLDSDIGVHKSVFEEMHEIFSDSGKISWFKKFFNKKYDIALETVTIDGKQANSAKDCEIILHCIELNEIRSQCAKYWDNLLSVNGVPKFFELDTENQENIAIKWIPQIQKYLNWYQDAYKTLLDKLNAVNLPADIIFEKNSLDSDIDEIEKIFSAIENIIPSICNIFMAAIYAENYSAKINETKSILSNGKRVNSKTCRAILSAIEQGDINAYSETFAELKRMYEKYSLQKNRADLLKTLEPVAPQWAAAIRNRVGIHGNFTVPNDIEDAWKWKQFCGMVEEITEKPFAELQADSLRLSKEYRKITALYAEKCSWYHLLKRTSTDKDMQQALQGWKQTVKKIGKGTGKQAPKHKARARELMTKCQKAVPAWIMPINRALESLNPKENRFDVVIIDEASQSDISSLAILYMGKKLIIVGDDKQVSPMAVGVESDKMSALQQMYIKDKIPNFHLYDSQTSIYDIAATTFQPLMLREHFRCVPEIIGFSNMLSYNYKIKPLREAGSSALLPAVINYRVADGKREGKLKTNPNEARAIVAIMKACMEQPEYAQKSFGVISLLGDEGGQVKLISNLIEQEIAPKEIKQRKILCGNSANFQGDERDVIFLSMVDSGEDDGPIRMMNFGIEDANRKRYNVAVSRARDQIWVVNSLDAANDLKPGDIRKILIDYSINPHSAEIEHSKIEEQAESPFEAEVAKNLVDRGYHIVQQWKVGAYRLDMVAVCGKNTVAIECDGERWHNGESKIREDMERQTILERIGWRFIRIRGSEYYRNSEKTMARVISELSKFGIEPEESDVTISEDRETELLNRVKNRAAIIMNEDNNFPPENFAETVEFALNSKSIFSDNNFSTPIKSTATEKSDSKEMTRNLYPVTVIQIPKRRR